MVASNLAGALTAGATIRLQWRSYRRLSHRLLQQYLLAPYCFHVNQNSARLVKSLLEEVNRGITKGFVPATRLLTQGISAILILGLLIWADPRLALTLSLVIGGFYSVVYALTRRKQQRWGEVASAAKTERLRIANEAFGGIKELKVLGREDHALARYRIASERFARAYAANGMVGVVPRFTLETLAYGGIVVAVLYLLQTRNSLGEIFPMLALYALGANRLMPAVQEIFHSLMQMKFGAAAVDSLVADLHGLPGSRLGPAPLRPAIPDQPTGPPPGPRAVLDSGIRFERVTFVYPGAPEPALHDVSLTISAGTTVALVGPTGSGKSTLMDLMLGLYPPSEGQILIDDRVLDAANPEGWQRRIGYVPQSVFMSDESITRNIAFGVPDDSLDFEAVRRAAHAAQLEEFVASLPDGYDTVVGERGVRLSGGQRQRIGIARALYHSPEVLLLDEATSALDSGTEAAVLHALQTQTGPRTIVLIAHRLTSVRNCDLIYVLDRGRVVAQGNYQSLVASHPSFRALGRVK